jgi:hypothetical protein
VNSFLGRKSAVHGSIPPPDSQKRASINPVVSPLLPFLVIFAASG